MSNGVVMRDVSASDSFKQLSAVITCPDQLATDVVHEVIFTPYNALTVFGGMVQVNWQLSVNYKQIAAVVNGVSQQCGIIEQIGNIVLNEANYSNGEGYNMSVGNYGECIACS